MSFLPLRLSHFASFLASCFLLFCSSIFCLFCWISFNSLRSFLQSPVQFVPSSSHAPRWLQVLLTEKFYNACIIHEEAKKNEKNVYCLDCCISLCPHCLSPHRSHRLLQVLFFHYVAQKMQTNPMLNSFNFCLHPFLQIRRYVYHDVVRLDDAAKLIDCTSVQVCFYLWFSYTGSVHSA